MPRIELKFPDWFVPKGDCPPPDAAEASGAIYCFAGSNSVDPAEFRSYYEKNERPNGPPCQRCGLSVFRNAEEVRRLLRHLWQSYPQRRYGPHVVKRELVPTDGKIKPTGRPGHHTWWAYDGVERHASFEFEETVLRD